MTGLSKTNRRYKVIVGVMTGLLKARPILEVVSIDDLLAAGELPPHLAGKARTDLITTWWATQERLLVTISFFIVGIHDSRFLPFSFWLSEGLFNDWVWQKPLTPILWELGTAKGRKGSHMASQRKGCYRIAARTIGGLEAQGYSYISLRIMRSPVRQYLKSG